MTNQIQVTLVRRPFKRTQMVAQIGGSVYSHYLLFGEEHTARAEKQAAAIQNLLLASKNPVDALKADLWEGPGKAADLQRRVFKPAA